MGFLSSLFQTGAPAPQVAGPTIATQKLPEELAPYYKDILGKAQALYKEKTAEGYQPYQGPTIADFTPEQQQAFTGLAGLAGQTKPVFTEAMDMTRTAATPMTQEQLTTYMSPYQQAVTDIEKREAQKQYESQIVPQLAAKAAMTQPFGGSRQAILEGMAADTQQRLLSDIQAKGSQQAYQDAIQRFAADRQAKGQAGAQLATMAPQQFKTQLGEFGAMQTVGEEKQRQQQTALDEAFRQYQLEQNYPYDTMSRYQSVVTGAPMGTTQFAPPPAPTPSIGQQLIGGIGTLAGTYGAFTGKNPLNLLTGKKHGGGLSDLPIVYRKDSGYVFKNYPASMVDVHPDRGWIPRGFSGDIHQGLEKTYPRDITDSDLYKINWDKLNASDKIKLQHSGVLDSGSSKDKLNALENYMSQKNYKGSAFQGNRNAIVESTITGDKTTFFNPRKQNIIQPTLGTTQPGVNTNTGLYDPNIYKDGEYGGVPQGEKLRINEENDSNRGDIDAGYREPPIDPKDVIPEPDLLQNFNRAGLEISELDRKIAMESKIAREKAWKEKEKGIQTAETDLETALAQRGIRNKELLTESEDARTRAQYGNLAQFFARLGTATPKQEGIAGVLGAGLESADATLPQFMATNEKYRDERIAIKKDMDNNKVDEAQLKLSTLQNRAARDHQNYVFEREESRYEKENIADRLDKDRTYSLNVSQLEADIAKLNMDDPSDLKTIIDNFDSVAMGATTLENGEKVFFDGTPFDAKSLKKRNDILQLYIKDVKDSAVSTEEALANIQLRWNTYEGIEDLPTVKTQADIDALPLDTIYIDAKGNKRKKS